MTQPKPRVFLFFVFFRNIPSYFIWLRYLSWFSYAFELLNVNQWSGAKISCPTLNSTLCVTHGEQIIEKFSFSEVCFSYFKIKNSTLTSTLVLCIKANWGTNFGCLITLLVVWRTLTFLILLYKSYKN
jgi:hypothetical protein